MDPTKINVIIGIIAGFASIGSFVYAIYKDRVRPSSTSNGGTGTATPPVVPAPPPKKTTISATKPTTNPPTQTKPPVVTETILGVTIFVDDDQAYQKWVEEHPQGFVINGYRALTPNYMMLHKATCPHISNFSVRKQGAFTEREFSKVCSTKIDCLRDWVKRRGRTDGSFTGVCGICKPAESN